MKENKFFNNINHNFHIYKTSCTMFLWGFSGVLGVLGNKFGTLYLLLSSLPIIVLVVLTTADRKDTSL